MKRWVAWALAALGLCAAGCQAQIKAEPASLAFYEAVHDHDDQRVRALGAPELLTPDLDAQLAAVRRFMPAQRPDKVEAVGHQLMVAAGAGETLSTTDVYQFGASKALVSTVLHRAKGAAAWQVQGFNFRLFRPQDLAANRFTLAGKPLTQDLFLAAMIAALLAMVAALAMVIRRKGLRRKWLWGVVAFAGVFTLRMNWTTGAFEFQPLSLQLIGAGATTQIEGMTPWILSFTVPVGAILILTGVWANPARARKRATETFE